MTLSYLNVVSVIILFQLTLLVFFLVTSKKGRRISNRILALFFTLLIINLADGLLTFYGFYTRFPAIAHLEDGFVFLLGPTIYFYTRTMIYNNFAIHRSHVVHAIPFVLVTVAYQLYYHLQDDQQQKTIQDAIINQTLPPGFYLSVVLIYLHVGTYIFLSLRELSFYRERIREQFSSVEEINMSWLSFMLWSIVAIVAMSLLYTFLPVVGLRDYFNLAFGIAFFLIFVFINGVVWKGLHQPQIFAGIETPGLAERKSPALSDLEKADIRKLLKTAMEENRSFLAPDLSLDGLASQIGYSPKKVSQLINDEFGQNFFDYINTFRIREAENIFRTSTDMRLTVQEAMYASGFSSKSSFNTIFKQKTGLTPTEYKRQVQAGRVTGAR